MSWGWVAATAAVALPAHAATYYVSPSGDDNQDGGSQAPWRSFAHAMTLLQPGDTLLLADGTYAETLAVTASGTPAAPLAIAALHDGNAVIDGAGVRVPCRVSATTTGRVHDVTVSGLVCRRSSADAFEVISVDRVTLQRVSAHGPDAGYVGVHVDLSTAVVLEDVIGSGAGVSVAQVLASSGVTVRRLYALQTPVTGAYTNAILVESSVDSLLENCIATQPGAGPPGSAEGIVVGDGSRVAVQGSVTYGIPDDAFIVAVSSGSQLSVGTVWADDVALEADIGFFQRADSDLLLSHVTAASVNTAFAAEVDTSLTFDAGYTVHATWIDSSVWSAGTGLAVSSVNGVTPSLAHDYDNFFDAGTLYSGTSASAHESGLDPGYDVATYGKGAYLFTPAGSALATVGSDGGRIGAEVLYRRVDGGVTGEPLWPWPMEARIQRELSRSATWESDGGLWRTLAGIYPGDGGSLSSPPVQYRVGCGCQAAPPPGLLALALAGLVARAAARQIRKVSRKR